MRLLERLSAPTALRIMAARGVNAPVEVRCLEDEMSEKVYEVPAEWAKRAFINDAKYQEMYRRSLADPDGFWAEQAKRLHWYRAPTKIKNTSFDKPNVSIKWFEDGTLNAAYNCIDRHLHERADQVAILWEGDDPKDSKKITYKELHLQHRIVLAED